jgi:hypothetical protein
MNDEQELTYPVRLARAVVTKITEREPDERLRRFFSVIADSLESHTIYKAWYIASFTSEGNSLSQWRAYCSNGGYSLGFDGQRLIAALPRATSYLYGQIIYDPQEQVKRVTAVITRYIQVWTALRGKHLNVPDEQYDRDVADSLNFWLARELIFFKIPAFAIESEWRLARRPVHSEVISFRSRNGTLTPYLVAPLVEVNTKLPINGLNVSPLGDRELAVHAAQSLLVNREYDDVVLAGPGFRLRF